jgi:hypothetical protein
MWAEFFPDRKPNHYVFPLERYGQGRDGRGATTYGTDPSQPIGTWKEAWEAANLRAGVECRFHDLRHTGCTRLLDAGVSHPIVAEIMGWSASTAIRMIKEVYGHIGLRAKQRAMELVEQDARNNQNLAGGAQKGTQSRPIKLRWFSKCLKKLAPQVGLEPTTLRLTAGCSAIELLRSGNTLLACWNCHQNHSRRRRRMETRAFGFRRRSIDHGSTSPSSSVLLT